MKSTTQTFSALAAVLLVGASTAHSQSVGDILGKAKGAADKIKKSSGGKSKKEGDAKDADKPKQDDTKDADKPKQSDPKDADKSSQDSAQDADKPTQDDARGRGGLPPNWDSMSPAEKMSYRRRSTGLPDKTVEAQQRYIREMQTNNSSEEPRRRGSLSRNNDYRALTVSENLPMKFTADDAAVKAFLAENLDTWAVMNAVAHGLVQKLHYGGGEGSYMRQGLSKVKELHFATTTARRDANNKDGGPFLYSFNAGTGVLTAAKVTPAREKISLVSLSTDSDSPITFWVLEHMTNAPSFRRGYVRSSTSSDNADASGLKTYTCDWCHQQIQSKTYPKATGCPKTDSGLHAWTTLR